MSEAPLPAPPVSFDRGVACAPNHVPALAPVRAPGAPGAAALRIPLDSVVAGGAA